MKERPILFSGAMIRAILAGQKTQTRRIVKFNGWPPNVLSQYKHAHVLSGEETQRLSCAQPADSAYAGFFLSPDAKHPSYFRCPYGQPGDQLWIRETWAAHSDEDHLPASACSRTIRFYKVEHGQQQGMNLRIGKWRPSIHMPRWHSRILLEIVSVRVERLQDISEADAEAEGCERLDSEREERDWEICPQCGGTGLYTALGAGGGVLPDTDCRECDTYAKRYRHLWENINGDGSWAANPWVWVIEFKRVETHQLPI